MNVTKAVITAAGPQQRTLPLQTLIDRDGAEKSVLRIVIEETLRAGVEEIGVVVQPGDAARYAEVAGEHAGRLHFVEQSEPRGHGHAVYCARDFVGSDGFLHLVGDHLYVDRNRNENSARQLVKLAEAEKCAVSAVQATREHLLPFYGTVGARRVGGRDDLYRVERVVEKPTPTEAELHLIVPGLRAGYYLCFFGMHVLTPTIFEILSEQIASTDGSLTLADALNRLPNREQYLALEIHDARYDVGVQYGLLTAQLALALNGVDRERVLSMLVELLAQREMNIKN